MPERKVPQHPLVARVRGGRAKSEQLTPIVGWQGDADDANRVRVYLDLGFTTYYEFSTDDVVETAPTDPDDENAPLVLWVRSTAKADLTRTQSVSGDIAFLTGGISRGNLARAPFNARYVSADRSVVPESGNWGCPIRTLKGPCETRNLFCPCHACNPTMESWWALPTIVSWC
jgi:hypothetical protein